MISDSSILLDTCIISNLLSKEENLAIKTKDLLKELTLKNNKFYISIFTKYELLRGADETQWEKAESRINEFKIVPHNEERFKRSILLHTAYSKNPNIKKSLHSISDIDVFIGSLIFTKQKSYLLTCDYFDFPRPYFNEIHIWNIEFSKKKGNKCNLYYYLLNANIESIF